MQALRNYQIVAIEQLRNAMVRHRRTILCVPTGGGKTTIVAEMIRRATSKGKSILFLAHRSELLQQAVERLQGFGLSPGIVQGRNVSNNPQLNVASVQTLRNRPNGIFPPDIIFIDECHLSMAKSYLTILERYPNAYVVGMTATPTRLDGKPLGDVYNAIVAPIKVPELTDNGFLCHVRKFGTKDKINLDGVQTSQGDFNAKQLFQRFDEKKLYYGVVSNYLQFAKDRPFICFCVNVEHSKKTAQEFQSYGINCSHLDGDSKQSERDTIIAKFRAGIVQGICNVGLFTEGFDVPHVSCVILNRATQSLALYLQMVGRGLRPYNNKTDCIIIDHGDNVLRHGWYDYEHEWSLTAKKKKSDKKQAMSVQLCSNCQAMMPVNLRTCPECGAQKIKKEKNLLHAEFTELAKPKVPENLRKPFSQMTRQELQEFADFKKYKPGWVYKQLQLRSK